jgi:hypothetical protein
MLPALISQPGAPWMVLPPGIHVATLEEVRTAFAINQRRRYLFEGLLMASFNLFAAGCLLIYLDGSYVTEKPMPGDYDACWDPQGVSRNDLDPVFLDFSNNRKAQKSKYRGEFFPSTLSNSSQQTFIEFFQIERFTGARKGIISINLIGDPMVVRRTAQ